MSAYAEWIENYANRSGGHDRLRGRCGIATLEMVDAFPELRRVPGFVYFIGGCSEHFWCVAPDGSVVDPTASQFAGITSYVEWQPGDEIRVGRCMECGDDIYAAPQVLGDPTARKTFCSPECAADCAKAFGWEVKETVDAAFGKAAS